MLFNGAMCKEVAKELTQRFGNPELKSKSLINKLLEVPTLNDDNASSLRIFVDNLHNIVSTFKIYGNGANLKAAADKQEVISRLSSVTDQSGADEIKLKLKPRKLT